MVMDESLAEHDKKYHPQGYKEGDKCNRRENAAKIDDTDSLSTSNGSPFSKPDKNGDCGRPRWSVENQKKNDETMNDFLQKHLSADAVKLLNEKAATVRKAVNDAFKKSDINFEFYDHEVKAAFVNYDCRGGVYIEDDDFAADMEDLADSTSDGRLLGVDNLNDTSDITLYGIDLAFQDDGYSLSDDGSDTSTAYEKYLVPVLQKNLRESGFPKAKVKVEAYPTSFKIHLG